MMNHAISDYFHFDHQFFHTLKPLFFKPGFLTNEYLAGRRAQYLHPVKMYIFISIVYFLLLFQSNHQVVTIKPGTGKTANTEKTIDNNIGKDKNLSPGQKRKLEQEGVKSNETASYGIIQVNEDARDKRSANTWFKPAAKDTTYEQYLKQSAEIT